MAAPSRTFGSGSSGRRLSGRVQIGTRTVRRYRGLQVCADTDLHERAIERLQTYVDRGASVVDVGCGEGAFALRMVDAGYAVVGLDQIQPGAHPAQGGFDYVAVDLLDAGARAAFLERHRERYDAVVLLEVIEHVHDPWQVLEFCRELVRPEGILLLSTPNLTSFFSRFRFLTSGRLHQFEPGDLEYGHINPMTAMMVATVLDETGFDLLEKSPGPRIPVLVWDSRVPGFGRRLFHMFSWLTAAALTPLMRGGDLDGWSLVFVARRRGPAGSAAG
jgi:2-polyprenyl-3-methyl-5-hydroxy-6-metoxy-1,4-benzoquinol methylase